MVALTEAAVNGSPPLQFDTEVISGEPLVYFHGTDGLLVGGVGVVLLTVTDSQGCKSQITAIAEAP